MIMYMCVQGSHLAQYNDSNYCDKCQWMETKMLMKHFSLQCALFLDAAHIRRNLFHWKVITVAC